MREPCEGGENLKWEKYTPNHACEADSLTAHFFQKFCIKMWSSQDTGNIAFKSWVCSRAEFCSLVSSWATRAAQPACVRGEGRRVGTSSALPHTAAFNHRSPIPLHGPARELRQTSLLSGSLRC